MDRVRVLYSVGGSELTIEIDRVDEKIVFVSSNKSGFSGRSLKELEDNANSTMVAARQFLSILEELKDIVHDRSPALLGYEGYKSKKEMRKIREDAKSDKVLKELKAYIKEDEDDAI